MKKITTLLLAALLLLSLAACSAKQPAAEPDSKTEAPATDAPATEAPATDASESEEPDVITGYANEDLGARYDLPDDWNLVDEASLAELNGLTEKTFGDEEIDALLKKNGTAMVLYAQSDDTMQTLNIVAENLNLLYTLSLDEEAYIDAAIPTVESGLAANGFTDIQIEKSTTTFLGSEHVCISICVTLQGAPLYETLVPVKSGSTVYVITAASYMEDRTGDVLACFTPLA